MNETAQGFSILLLILAFTPSLIAGLAPGRLLLALLVFVLNVGSIAGLALFVLPGVVLWFVALILAVSVYNGAKRDKHERELLRVLKQAAERGPGPAAAPGNLVASNPRPPLADSRVRLLGIVGTFALLVLLVGDAPVRAGHQASTVTFVGNDLRWPA